MLAHDVSGSGPAVLLLHAGVADRRMWAPVVERLEDRQVRLIRPDLRGFGDTPVGRGAYSNTGDVVELLDGLGEREPVTVCGNSYGGGVALELAAYHPERVARLVLAAPALPGWEWSQNVRSFGAAEEAAIERDDLDEAVAVNVRMWAATLPPEHQALVATMQRRAFELQLDGEDEEEDEGEFDLVAVRGPAHILVGEADVEDFGAIAAKLAATIPGATLERIPGAGHLLPLERPDAVAAALLP